MTIHEVIPDLSAGWVSSEELTRAALASIERLNPGSTHFLR